MVSGLLGGGGGRIIGRATMILDADSTALDAKLAKARGGIGALGGVGAGLAAGVGAAVLGGSAALISYAIDAEHAWAQMRTMLDVTDEEFQKIQADVGAASTALGFDLVDTIAAAYQALSAGVPSDELGGFLEQAGQTAIGGATDMLSAVDLLTSAIRAYNLDFADAETVSDIFFTAVKSGKTTIGELSRSIGMVAPTAAAQGVALEDLAASMASMTLSGINTSRSAAGLRQLIVSLLKPTGDAERHFDALGFSFADAIASGTPFPQILRDLTTAATDAGIPTEDLFGSVEALDAALALVSDTTWPNTEGVMGEMEDRAGATGRAFAIMEDTTRQSINETRTAILNALEQEINDALEAGEGNILLAIGAMYNTLREQALIGGAALAGDFAGAVRDGFAEQVGTDGLLNIDLWEGSGPFAPIAAAAQTATERVDTYLREAIADIQAQGGIIDTLMRSIFPTTDTTEGAGEPYRPRALNLGGASDVPFDATGLGALNVLGGVGGAFGAALAAQQGTTEVNVYIGDQAVDDVIAESVQRITRRGGYGSAPHPLFSE